MDFQTATDEVYRVEQDAKEYVPPKPEKYEAQRLLELSPPDIHEMEYGDIISQYMRIEKIISASSMDAGLFGGESPPSPISAPSPEKVSEVEQEMQKISVESAKEAAQISKPLPGIKSELDVSMRLPIPSTGSRREEPRLQPSPASIEREKVPPPPDLPKKPEWEEADVQKTVEEELRPKPLPEEEEEPQFLEDAAQSPEEEAEQSPEEELPGPSDGWEIPLGEEEPEAAGEGEAVEPKKPPQAPSLEEQGEPEADTGIPFGFEELPDEIPSSPKSMSLRDMDTLSPSIRIPVPAFLSESPIDNAEAAIAKLETQLGAQMMGKKTKKVDTVDTKKRMLELTRELFKERSMNRRAEIKKEIVMLKDFLTQSKKTGKAETGGLPEGSMYSALRSEQDYEFKEALDRAQEIYEDNKKVLVSAMNAKRAVEHRESAFDAFSKNMVDLEQGLDSLMGMYQVFLTKKHLAELQKLQEKGQATKDSLKFAATLEDVYSREFSSLKNTIGEQIHSQIETTRAVLFESAGDPEARQLSQITNSSEENTFNFLQAKDSRTYEKYARGEITRSQAIAYARRLMAKDAGVDEDTINKSFGSK